MIKAYDQIRMAAEAADLVVEPVGWRRGGITVHCGTDKVQVDLDRMGRIKDWVLWEGAVIKEHGGPDDTGKLEEILGIIARFWKEGSL